MTKKLPLSGVKVLDMTQVMAGPFCSMMLGDLGADVIKVESPDGGDQTRGAMGFKLKGSDSMGFLNLNRNKRSIALNLKVSAGREAFFKLVESADIVIENYRPGVVQRLGVSYEDLRSIRPELVYASISGFGQDGPWAARPGFDLMAQAMGGVMSVTGYPGGLPVKAGVPVADIGCALFAAYAILSAYIGRLSSGQGQYIDASLFDAVLAFSIWEIAEYWGTGKAPVPVGTSNKMSAPYQAFKASDGYFVLGATNQRLWSSLCQILKRDDLLSDQRFSDNAKRLAQREALVEELERSFVLQPMDHWIDLLLAQGIPAGPILSYPQAFASAHSQHREMQMEISHPIEGTIPNIGFPVKLRGTPAQVRRPPPLLAQHTGEILNELGINPVQLQRWTEQGAFAP